MARNVTCSGGRIPEVELVFSKKSCLVNNGARLNSPEALAAFVTKEFGCIAQEVVLSVLFNTANEVIAIHRVATGGVASAQIDPRVFFNGAIQSNAAGFCLVHTHPSGNAQPSSNDVELTKRLLEGARLLGLRLFDHVIVARGGGYYSFAANGMKFDLPTYEAPLVAPTQAPLPEEVDPPSDELVAAETCAWPRR